MSHPSISSGTDHRSPLGGSAAGDNLWVVHRQQVLDFWRQFLLAESWISWVLLLVEVIRTSHAFSGEGISHCRCGWLIHSCGLIQL